MRYWYGARISLLGRSPRPIGQDRPTDPTAAPDVLRILICLLLVGGLGVAGCVPASDLRPTGQPVPQVEATATATSRPAIGMPNPASAYCAQNGGKLEIRKDAQGGEYGVCIFADGSECEEWAFFRGECRPGVHFPTRQPGGS